MQQLPRQALRLCVLTLSIVSVVPIRAQVNRPAPANQPDARQMMEAMQEMQACMAGVDRAALQRLQAQAERAQGEIRSLCRSGNEAAAQGRALQLSREMVADPTLKKMQACLARLPQLPMAQALSPLSRVPLADDADEGAKRSLCERVNR